VNRAKLFSTISPSGRRYTLLLLRAPAIFLTILLLMAVGVGAAQAGAPAQANPPAQVASPADTTSVQLASPLRQVLSVAPGGSYKGEIVLVNGGNQAATVQVSQVDFLPTEEGVGYPEPGSLPRSNARWFEVSPGDVQIPAGEEVVVPYSIKVPNDPSLAGSYWSMILLTPSDAAGVQETQEGEVQTTVRTQFRYGVSVVTNLGDSGESGLSFENPQFVRPEDGAATHLQVSLQNTGERLLSPEVQLELYDESGAQVDRLEAQAERIFPGGSVRQDFELGTLAPGAYTAVVIADAGGEAVFGTRYTLNVGDGDTP
jgi:hypothetical protein